LYWYVVNGVVLGVAWGFVKSIDLVWWLLLRHFVCFVADLVTRVDLLGVLDWF